MSFYLFSFNNDFWTDLSIALDNIADSPEHVLTAIDSDLKEVKEKLNALKLNMSEELEQKLFDERIDAAKETLQSTMVNAQQSQDVQELSRQLTMLNSKENEELRR